jgi:hypothetical protein
MHARSFFAFGGVIACGRRASLGQVPGTMRAERLERGEKVVGRWAKDCVLVGAALDSERKQAWIDRCFAALSRPAGSCASAKFLVLSSLSESSTVSAPFMKIQDEAIADGLCARHASVRGACGVAAWAQDDAAHDPERAA